MSAHELRSPRTLPVLFGVIILDLIGFGIVVPVLPYIANEHGANGAVLGLLLTSYAAMQFIFAPMWGRLSDRIGRRPVMLMTIAGTSVCLLILGLATSLLWLFVARLLGGLFAANIGVATAYVSDVTDEAERTRWMGMVGASFGIGFILGPAIGGGLSVWGYGTPMLFAAALVAINFVFALGALTEPSRHRGDAVEQTRLELLRSNAELRLFCLVNFIFSFAVTQLESMFAFLMLHRFGYDAMQVAAVLVAMALVMAGIQGGGIRHLAKRFGERQLLVVGVALMGIGFLAIPWIHSIGILMVPLLISAVGRAIGQPSMMSMVSMTATSDNRGAVMGNFQSAASLARTFGPVTAGLLYDADERFPFLLAGVLMAVALGLCVRLPEHASEQSTV